jgi:NADPH:quinone reductase-like Zn-dependent oxidoreductase
MGAAKTLEHVMKAAVVSAFDTPPTYREFPTPQPLGASEALVDVMAVGLHPRVRSQASGSHYTSTDQLPLVPGVDGVGRDAFGALRYFILADTTVGAMAQQTVIDLRRSVVLPDHSDPILIAAAMNPAMSSWVALRRRIDFQAGQSVLVLGATGNAGRLAIQVAKHLGASRVIGVGRDARILSSLTRLGADAIVSLEGDPASVSDRLGHAAAGVDVVIDYLWGQPTALAMAAAVRHRGDRAQPLAWIEIGSVAGPTAAIPSAALRAGRLQIVGSGQGSVPARDFVAELPELAREISAGTFSIQTRTVPLDQVTAAWTDRTTHERVVIVP